MTKDGKSLTAANIRYLLVIRELDSEKRGVRGSDIAQQLGVTKPSVFAMMRNLLELGLVKKEKYGNIFLTELGRRKANQYADCYALLDEKMRATLELPPEDSRGAVCSILAQTDPLKLDALCGHLREKEAAGWKSSR